MLDDNLVHAEVNNIVVRGIDNIIDKNVGSGSEVQVEACETDNEHGIIKTSKYLMC